MEGKKGGTIWHYRLWSFQERYIKLARFLPKPWMRKVRMSSHHLLAEIKAINWDQWHKMSGKKPIYFVSTFGS